MMRALCLLSSLIAAGILADAQSDPVPNSELAVRTTSGTYSGFVNSTTPDVNIWLGIPFGTPPVGARRFLKAEKAPDYGVANATAYKPICFQDNNRTTGVFWTLVPEFQNTDTEDEDCLYLNIWAPRKPLGAKKVPVIIWVFGGGFREGGGHAPYQVPDQWIQKSQTHIVVTFNYRLNVFGFPAARGAIGNPGFSDTRLVVEWLRDNVAGFGGDPARMILWGQSAGAGAVLAYSYANPKDPIVTGFIASSGGSAPAAGNDTSGFTEMAGTLGCGNLTASDELTCMQKVDATLLQKFLRTSANNASAVAARRYGTIVADNETAFANNTERLLNGLVAKLPLITGSTTNEAAALAPFSLNDTGPAEGFDMRNLTSFFVCGMNSEADARVRQGLTVYRYLFSGNFSNITPRWWLGAMHSSDIPIVFGTHNQFRGNSTELEWETSRVMQDFWVSFAANSSADPTDTKGLVWPEYTNPDGEIVVFGNGTKGAEVVSKNISDSLLSCSS